MVTEARKVVDGAIACGSITCLCSSVVVTVVVKVRHTPGCCAIFFENLIGLRKCGICLACFVTFLS